MNSIANQMIEALHLKANEKKARWLENYVKHDIRSLGVGIPEIRELLLTLNKEQSLTQLDLADQIDLLNALMQSEFTESKLAAILYLQLFWEGLHLDLTLQMVSDWFDLGYIWDWNVCDWLCVRVLSPMLNRCPDWVLPTLTLWNAAANHWKARASLVPFAYCDQIVGFRQTIEAFSSVLIQREERFAKTAVGWVLREYSRVDMQFVKSFLEEHAQWTTKEVIKNATKYL